MIVFWIQLHFLYLFAIFWDSLISVAWYEDTNQPLGGMSVLNYRIERGPRYGFKISWHFAWLDSRVALAIVELCGSAWKMDNHFGLRQLQFLPWGSQMSLNKLTNHYGLMRTAWNALKILFLPGMMALAQSWFYVFLHLFFSVCLLDSLEYILRVLNQRKTSLSCLFTSRIVLPQDLTCLTWQFERYKTSYLGFWPFFLGMGVARSWKECFDYCQNTNFWYQMVLIVMYLTDLMG